MVPSSQREGLRLRLSLSSQNRKDDSITGITMIPPAMMTRLLKEEDNEQNKDQQQQQQQQDEPETDDIYVDYVPTAISHSFLYETWICMALVLLLITPLTLLLRKRKRKKRRRRMQTKHIDSYYLKEKDSFDSDNASQETDDTTSTEHDRRLAELATSKYIRMDDLPDVIANLLPEEDQPTKNKGRKHFAFLKNMEGLGALAIVLNQGKGRLLRKRQRNVSTATATDDENNNDEEEDGNCFLEDVPSHELAWEELPCDSRASAIALGYNQDRWDNEHHSYSSTTHVRNRNDSSLPTPNATDYPYKKPWNQLTDGNRSNAMSLGYTVQTWDEEHSHSPFAQVPAKGNFCLAMFSCWDQETKKIFQLAIPGFVGSASSAVCGAMVSAMISLHLGAANYVAYSMAYVFVGLAQALYGGIPSACSILVAQSIGSNNLVLAGQYEQASYILVWTFGLPLYAAIYCFFPTLIHLFGLEEEVADRGNELVAWLILAQFIVGISWSVSDLMWADERGTTMTVLDNIHNGLYLGMMSGLILCPQWFHIEQVSLRHIGIAEVISSFLYNMLIFGYVHCKGWLEPYKEGLFGHFALSNRKLVKSILTISLPLTLGGIVSTCEWEILTLFAAHMGTPEVAAWTILGSIWSLFEYVPMGFLTAAELRVSRHLGQGNPGMAKLAAYKTMLYCMTLTALVTIPWVVFRDVVIGFYTDVEVIKDILDELVLALGVANFVMVLGVAAYTILCAQNRTKLASGIYAILSFCATLPLSTYFVYYKGYDLYSILFSMIVGYSLSSLLLLLFLLTTNWRRCSQRIINKSDKAAKEHEKVMNTSYPVLDESPDPSSSRESHRSMPSITLNDSLLK